MKWDLKRTKKGLEYKGEIGWKECKRRSWFIIFSKSKWKEKEGGKNMIWHFHFPTSQYTLTWNQGVDEELEIKRVKDGDT